MDQYLNSRIATGKWIRTETLSNKLKEALDETIQRLGEIYKKAFACLGVFAGSGFDSRAVKAVCDFDSDDTTEDFLALLRKRFLIRENTTNMFSLHPVIRQYARDLLDRQNIRTPYDRYLAYYSELLRAYGGYEWNLGQYKNLVPYETEVINAVNTADDLSKCRTFDRNDSYCWLLVDMTAYISWYLFWRGYWDLRIQFCRRITDRLEESGLLRDSHSEFAGIGGNLYVDRGWIHLGRNELDETKKCADRGQLLLLSSGDLIFAKELCAQVQLKSGNPHRAYELFLELCKGSRTNTRNWFVFSFRLSDALVELKNYDHAVKLLENLLSRISCAELHQNQIISDIHARIAFRLASQKLREGNLFRARELLESAVGLFDESGIVDVAAVSARIELAKLLLPIKGERMKAQELLDDSLRQARIIGEIDLSTRIESMLNASVME